MSTDSNWMKFLQWDHIVGRCDATTGHAGKTVAMCDSEELAAAIVGAIDTLIQIEGGAEEPSLLAFQAIERLKYATGRTRR